MTQDQDASVRAAAFAWLERQVARLGSDVLPRELLAEGFQFNGVRVPLVGPQGIFKPKVLRDAPLSLTTTPGGPYNDAFGPDDLLRYRYRGDDPDHPDNVGLRRAMETRRPLVYFHGIARGKYFATWPVYVVADSPGELMVTVAVDDVDHLRMESRGEPEVRDHQTVARRTYVTALVRVRLHQRTFRERVLEAHRRQCAFCWLRHEELLDAAHIVPDSRPLGEPSVNNGLALCKLHHGAFDGFFVGLRPDYVIEVRQDILHEKDGPTLAHAIQGLHGRSIILPRAPSLRPSRQLLELRYEEFRRAS